MHQNRAPTDPYGILSKFSKDELSSMQHFSTCRSTPRNIIDICISCGTLLQRTINGQTAYCDSCGSTCDEIRNDIEPEFINIKLKLVGPGHNYLQANLYKSGTNDNAVLQKKQILCEYEKYRQKYLAKYDQAWPLNACKLATEYYNQIQKRPCVKRGQNKYIIMAACLWIACLAVDFAPSKIDVAKFMELNTKGFSKGTNFIRDLVTDEGVNIPIDIDITRPHINTLLLQLSYSCNDDRESLIKIIIKFIDFINSHNIGLSSFTRSRIIGSTYLIIKRCTDPRLILTPPIVTKDFIKINNIRKGTIDSFIETIKNKHDLLFCEYFELNDLKSEIDFY